VARPSTQGTAAVHMVDDRRPATALPHEAGRMASVFTSIDLRASFRPSAGRMMRMCA